MFYKLPCKYCNRPVIKRVNLPASCEACKERNGKRKVQEKKMLQLKEVTLSKVNDE